uniref:Uncharacterized protein n=1 Tax=Trichogramma kaykai TaxID=54128 RepID=A0ABD2W103_9HYME
MYEPEQQEERRRAEERETVRQGTELWRARKEQLLRQKRHEQSQLRRMLANYWPWGRAGAGAPCAASLRKRNIPLDPSTQQQQQRCPLQFPQVRATSSRPLCAFTLYFSLSHSNSLKFLQSWPGGEPTSTENNASIDPRWEHRDEINCHCNFCKSSLVRPPRVSQQQQQQQPGNSTHRVHPFQSVNATKHGYTIDSWRTESSASRDYITDLSEQIRAKEMKQMEERRREGESCRQHMTTWQRLWGRPARSSTTRALVRSTTISWPSVESRCFIGTACASQPFNVLRCIGLVEQQNNKPTITTNKNNMSKNMCFILCNPDIFVFFNKFCFLIEEAL